MATNEYHFTTHWRIRATLQEIIDVLEDPTDLPRWWPSVYLDVRLIERGDEQRVGEVIDLYTKGWLPYTLRWRFRITEVVKNRSMAFDAFGDFAGRGEWKFEPDGEWTNVIYDWRIRAAKPLLRRLSFLLRPIFSINHEWAMKKGEESLKLELARRRAKTAEERNRIPPPPGRTFAWFARAPSRDRS